MISPEELEKIRQKFLDTVNNSSYFIVKDKVITSSKRSGSIKSNIAIFDLLRSEGLELSIGEFLYLFREGLERTVSTRFCPVCGKPNFLIRNIPIHYSESCSLSCSSRNPSAIEARNKTMLERYGSTSAMRNEKIKEKRNRTCREKYGVDNPLSVQSIREKAKITNLEKYGVENPSYFPELIQKSRETFRKNCEENPDFADSIQRKRRKSRLENDTFADALLEQSYDSLKERFRNVIRRFRNKKFPFVVDFYVPQYELFIDCQYNDSHGSEPFDPLYLKHWDRLEELNNVNNQDEIRIWTQFDVTKRKYARNHDVNYIEFFRFDELVSFSKPVVFHEYIEKDVFSDTKNDFMDSLNKTSYSHWKELVRMDVLNPATHPFNRAVFDILRAQGMAFGTNEFLYLFRHGAETTRDERYCSVCGGVNLFVRSENPHYALTCSQACSYQEAKERREQTMIERFGYSSAMKNDDVKEKRNQTCREKYGVDNPLSDPAIREKMIVTINEKYGVDNVIQNPDILQHREDELLRKYGITNVMQIPEIVNKAEETKIRNGTFAKSQLEDEAYDELVRKFGIDDVIRQYKDERYPYRCDFYIKSKDLFI